MPNSKSEGAEKYFALGVSFALIYALVIIPFSLLSFFGVGPFKWPDKLNELGDFLAGVCSPLAFLFFVISVLIQREEFRLTREEMESSRDELNKQVSQLKLSGISPILKESIENYYLNIKDVLFTSHGALQEFASEGVGIFSDEFFINFRDSLKNDLKKENNNIEFSSYSKFRRNSPENFIEKIRLKLGFSCHLYEIKSDIEGFVRVVDFFVEVYFQADMLSFYEFEKKSVSIFLRKEYCNAYEKAEYIIDNWGVVLSARDKYLNLLDVMDKIKEECEAELGVRDEPEGFF